MSEQDIHGTLPMGSPILAYGTGPRTSHARTILAISAGIFVALVVCLVLALRTQVQMPTRIAALMVVRGKTTLPDSAPAVWRQSVAHSSMPVMLGITMDEQGAQPFAVTFSSPVKSTFAHIDSGAVSVLFDDRTTSVQSWPLSRLVSFAFHTITSPAYLQLDASAVDPSFDTRVEGPINSHGIWITDAETKGDGHALPNGDFSVNLSSFPQTWPFIQQALPQTAALNQAQDTPESIAWNQATSSVPNLILQFPQAPSTSTLLTLAGIAGLSEQVPYRLNDDVIAQELRLPTELLTSTSSAPISTSTTTLTINGNRISIQPLEAVAPLTLDVAGCEQGDQAVFHLSPQFIRLLGQRDGLQFLTGADGLTASIHTGKLEFCTQSP